MHPTFLSGLSEVLSRAVGLTLVLVFFTIYYIARGSIPLNNSLSSYGALIAGSVILYELVSFIFFELFMLVEKRVAPVNTSTNLETETKNPTLNQDNLNIYEK